MTSEVATRMTELQRQCEHFKDDTCWTYIQQTDRSLTWLFAEWLTAADFLFKVCKLHGWGLSTPPPIYDKNCSFASGGGGWNVFHRGVVCLLVFWASGLWRVGEGRRYGFTPLGRARPRCWQQVLFDVDVPCWVTELASTYDLHYDQRRKARWWLVTPDRQGVGGLGGWVGRGGRRDGRRPADGDWRGRGKKCRSKETNWSGRRDERRLHEKNM